VFKDDRALKHFYTTVSYQLFMEKLEEMDVERVQEQEVLRTLTHLKKEALSVKHSFKMLKEQPPLCVLSFELANTALEYIEAL